MRFWKREPLLTIATALSIVYGVVSLTTSHLGNPYIVIMSLMALVFMSRNKVTPALRGHPVAPPGEAVPHEHWPVSVHLAGYPERGVWKDSLIAYLCADVKCWEQLTIEEVESGQAKRDIEGWRQTRGEQTPIVHGLPDSRRIPGNPRRIGLSPDHLTSKDGGGRPLYGWSLLPGPNCAYCDAPFRMGDEMHSVHGHSVHAECETLRSGEHVYNPPAICEEEEEWLWQ